MEDSPHHIHAFEVPAELKKMINLVVRQGVLYQAIKEDARLFDRRIKRGRAGMEAALGCWLERYK